MEQNTQIAIPRSQFTRFLGAIKLIENACTDCHINEGFVRQKTNDRHSIIEIDLSSVIGDNELILSNIKQKVMLLKSFELDDTVTVNDENILIEINDKDYKFIDPFSKMTFRKTLVKFLDNTYVTTSQFDSLVKYTEDDLIFSVSVNSYMCKRIKGICQGFNNETIRCDFNGVSASLSVSTINNESCSTVYDSIDLNKEFENCYFKAVYLPFSLDNTSEITFKTYQISSDVLLCKFVQTYYGIPVTIYSQAKLVSASE